MRRLKYSLRSLLLLLLCLALCTSMISPAFAEAASEESTEPEDAPAGEAGFEISSSVDNQDFNLILLIDRSGSMQETDRSKLVKDAAKLFVDLCDERANSRIAVMSFDTAVNNSGFITMDDEEHRDMVKEYISNITYADGGTDIGYALLSAINYIQSESDPSHKNMIVMFTDGFTQDLVDKKLSESEEELQQALEKAVEYDCRIYTIGTDYNGSMKQTGRQSLEGIRDYQLTHGATNSADELLIIIDAKDQDGMKTVLSEFENIYATIGNRIIHKGNLIIESPNVSEANIIISAPDGISEAKLTAPSGNSAAVDLGGGETTLDGAKIVFKSGKAYQLIKIVEPIPMGTWVIDVADNQSQPILNYTWMLTEKAEITMKLAQKSKKTAQVTVRPKSIELESVEDFYNSLTEKSVVISKDGAKDSETTMELEYDRSGSCLTVTFPVEPLASYTVTAKVSDGYFVRTVTHTIKIQKDWKAQTAELGDLSDFGTIYVWNWFSSSVDLSDRLGIDVEDCESVDGGGSVADYELDGTVIKVRSRNAGSEDIRVKGYLEDGSEVELTGSVKVLNPIFPILGGVLVLAFIAWQIYRRRQRKTLRGKLFFKFTVTVGSAGKYALPEVFIPSCRVFSLYDVLMSYRRDVQKPDWEQVLDRKVLDKNSKYFKTLKASKFTVCKDELSFTHEGTLYKRHDTEFEWISDDGLLIVSFTY